MELLILLLSVQNYKVNLRESIFKVPLKKSPVEQIFINPFSGCCFCISEKEKKNFMAQVLRAKGTCVIKMFACFSSAF